MSAPRGAEAAWLRWWLLALASLGVFAPLVLHGGRESLSLAQQLGCLVLVLGPALMTGSAEPEAEGVSANLYQRGSRLAPTALAMALGGALLFPTAWTWRYAWFLFLLHLPIPPLWNLRRARATSLGILSLEAMVSTILAPPAGAWALLPVALLWLGLPALDRLERLERRAGPGARSGLPATLLGVLGALAVGGLVFGAGVLLLPPSQPLPVWARSAFPGSALPHDAAPAAARAPFLEMGLLLLGVVALLVLFQLGAGTRRAAGGSLREAGAMSVSGSTPLDPAALARAVAAWPAGPRRDLVEAYLAHLQELAASGHARPPGASPLRFAELLGAGQLAAGGEAEQLAAAFSRARWGPGPVEPAAVEAARAWAEAVRRRLETR